MATGATLDELPPWAQALVDESRVAHLGILDTRHRPRVLPVTFAVVDGAVWSAVDHKPKRRPGEELARVRWLRERPESTLTVDRYDDDWARLAWVQLIGTTAVVDVAGNDEVLAALAARYPQYRDRPPLGPLLRLTAERTVCWSASEPGG
ncbi:MAG: TIGR03668 family PPOX class F420-dependent oxidoreductase [Actinomycetota bacterium]